MKEFRFHPAAHEIYDLVWSCFCDWFIEAEKVPMREGGEARERALHVLDYALFRILRLLHPFMPFITEELAHQMGFLGDSESIMFESYPESDELAAADPALIAAVDGKFALIRAGRALKSNYNIPDGKKVHFYIKAVDDAAAAFLNAEAPSVKHLLNATEVEISTADYDTAARGAAPSQVSASGTIYLPLAGLIDIAEELAKLEKQQRELEGWIKASQAKLSNERFLAKAPEQVVSEARAHLEEMQQRLERVISLQQDLR